MNSDDQEVKYEGTIFEEIAASFLLIEFKH